MCEGGGRKIFSRPAGLKRSRCSPYATSPYSNRLFHSGVSCPCFDFLGETLSDLCCTVWCRVDPVVDTDTVRDRRRPCAPLKMSCFSFDGRLDARCEAGILLSFELR